MHEERGFLYALREHPEDDVTRLVYADWLEERDDPRAVYLRGEVALARMAEGDDGYEAAEAELAEMREDIVPQWLEQAGKRWDVVLLGYSAAHEIHAIRVVREAVSYDPSEALVLVESAPSIIWIAAIRSAAEKVRGILIGRHPESTILAEIVPNTDSTKEVVYTIESRGLSCTPHRWQPTE